MVVVLLALIVILQVIQVLQNARIIHYLWVARMNSVYIQLASGASTKPIHYDDKD
jgi:hypothetical protein